MGEYHGITSGEELEETLREVLDSGVDAVGDDIPSILAGEVMLKQKQGVVAVLVGLVYLLSQIPFRGVDGVVPEEEPDGEIADGLEVFPVEIWEPPRPKVSLLYGSHRRKE